MLSGYSHLIGGLAGGATSTLVCHPLDLLRIRYAANEGNYKRPQYKSYWDACQKIVRVEGVRGIYQGLAPSLIATPLGWGLYFHIYHKIHSHFVSTSDPKKQSVISNFFIGCSTGGIVCLLTNPIWIAKTRLCLQYENSAKPYKGTFDCLRKIYRVEGVRGWYKGFVLGLFGQINGSLQFALYNFMRDYRCASLGLQSGNELPVADYLLFSCVSRIFSVLATYPYQVIRTRLQDHNVVYDGLRDCIAKTWRIEGIRGMYKGALIACMITYITYEETRRLIEQTSDVNRM